MITAREAKNRTLESDKIKEMLKGKQYEGICENISNHIKKQADCGCFFVELKTNFMYPFKDEIISELQYNGYKVGLYPSVGWLPEYLRISWN